jgi:hypothetical protein
VVSQLEFAAIMAPANENSWWYYGLTGEQVSQYLTQNKAMLSEISGYVDDSGTVKYAVVMEPVTHEWWWYYGLTAEQVGQYLTENKASLTSISAYIDTSDELKFAAVMAPADQEWWWYYGLTGDQVGEYLAQNKTGLVDICAYIDTDTTVKFAVIMGPVNHQWWWYVGATAEQVGQYLTQNKSGLTSISAYIDTSNELKFAVIMGPADQEWWWYYGFDAARLGQQLTANKARLTSLSPFMLSTTNSITINSYPNVSGLNGSASLTIESSGAYSFSGGWSPSNWLSGLASQDVNLVLVIRDIRGTAWVFSTAGNVPSEGSYNFNNAGTNAALAEAWQFLSLGYSWHDDYSASIDLTATWNDIKNWYDQNQQTIDTVVQVVGEIAAVAAG